MKIFEKTYKVINILTLIFIILYLNNIYQTKSICGLSFAIVHGNSMYPNLKDGDFLVVNQNADYQINDIICFYNEENKRVVHRIVDINDNVYITKGDFNKDYDKPLNANQIIGKVVYKSSILGLVFENLHIAIIVFIIFCFFMLKNLDKYDKMYI